MSAPAADDPPFFLWAQGARHAARLTGLRPVSLPLLLLFLLPLLAACGAKEKAAPLPRGSTVLALGDSLTAGYGLDPAQAWPALLAAATGWRIVNAGVSGDTSAGGLARLPALLDANTPRLVLVALGGNDMLRHLPEDETRANLARIIALARSRGAHVVLLAIPKPSIAGAVFRSLSDAPFYDELAREQGVPLLAGALADVLSDPDLKLDQLHPNAEGQHRLAEKLFDALSRLGFAS
ncbi:MAG TPA: arylesterase [Candidatus Desulfobacillus sp.]|nr:arylesterase [Candidatus Desulfobacillus sp.]